jgi:hypothetical protein
MRIFRRNDSQDIASRIAAAVATERALAAAHRSCAPYNAMTSPLTAREQELCRIAAASAVATERALAAARKSCSAYDAMVPVCPRGHSLSQGCATYACIDD